ncbi:5-methyltetrahydropteroyltriglutamate--homocysteine methyltransferase [Parafrankia irregularis]|uniref:5-methyltetrahydropteroyltriglutamate--homocysteine methyltransferase n=1 Tax=Parafrankia irregularis TaxID=795642 RepID=A0A0S4QXD6_9ACTN|nr:MULTISPECIES: cobalamin-independent methionine synthase II family protein [Frankiaceae]KPM50867.1 enterotoxin [Frankia sp. R43]MBE3204785.1 cobalamin-independent methionine synthase II family protein [Parafrankia sp. CH37]CUU59114.1 5-methyltetrahydropteroyltriglutamate--homocysteine methyltransferase [Parafrankia irregularis]
MKLSSERILTTHTGSLPRPAGLAELIRAREQETLSVADAEHLPDRIADAVSVVVDHQARVGLDVISDGEMSKIGYATYVKERLTGFDVDVAVPECGGLSIADLDDYPGMAERSLAGLETATPTCTGPISYTGSALLDTDLASFAAGVGSISAGSGQPAERFMNAASPGVIALYLPNQFYAGLDEYLFALAEAMRVEYEAITAAGLVLQIDAPDLAMGRHIQYTHLSEQGFLDRLRVHVEAVNHALRNIDPARVRVHLCWGNYQGPHHKDVGLDVILDTILQLKADGLVFEAANHRHAHEWQVLADAKIPEQKVLIPGVIDTSSVYIEHPELIAQRITRFADIVGRERVIPGTDCGFASFATFLAVDESLAWAKLESLTAGARLASDRLWS